MCTGSIRGRDIQLSTLSAYKKPPTERCGGFFIDFFLDMHVYLQMFRIPKTKTDWVDEIGSWTGVIAALLIASNIGAQGIAFCIFLMSCCCYIYIARIKHLPAMMRMNEIFFFINVFGIWRWIIAPWLGI